MWQKKKVERKSKEHGKHKWISQFGFTKNGERFVEDKKVTTTKDAASVDESEDVKCLITAAYAFLSNETTQHVSAEEYFRNKK